VKDSIAKQQDVIVLVTTHCERLNSKTTRSSCFSNTSL